MSGGFIRRITVNDPRFFHDLRGNIRSKGNNHPIETYDTGDVGLFGSGEEPVFLDDVGRYGLAYRYDPTNQSFVWLMKTSDGPGALVISFQVAMQPVSMHQLISSTVCKPVWNNILSFKGIVTTARQMRTVLYVDDTKLWTLEAPTVAGGPLLSCVYVGLKHTYTNITVVAGNIDEAPDVGFIKVPVVHKDFETLSHKLLTEAMNTLKEANQPPLTRLAGIVRGELDENAGLECDHAWLGWYKERRLWVRPGFDAHRGRFTLEMRVTASPTAMTCLHPDMNPMLFGMVGPRPTSYTYRPPETRRCEDRGAQEFASVAMQ